MEVIRSSGYLKKKRLSDKGRDLVLELECPYKQEVVHMLRV